MGKLKYICLLIFVIFCFVLAGCSEPDIMNDTPPEMMPKKDNVFTISNDTDIVYRGEPINTNDLVYRGEKYSVKNL